MLSACVDTNVIISGFVFGGKPLECIAKAFRKEYQLILWYLEISEANMEKGEMRVEANVSISPDKNKKSIIQEIYLHRP